MKALPHVGEEHGEMVCCAGVTLNREWRRQFPVNFRYLKDKKFKRWQWIEYDWRKPTDDRRRESQRVQEGTIRPGRMMPRRERAAFLQPLIRGSTSEATERGETLTLIRPVEPRFRCRKKDTSTLDKERAAYALAADQLSFFAAAQRPLDPCPYEFIFRYQSEDGPHEHQCGEWETAAMYFKFSRRYGEQGALDRMMETFNNEYPEKGMVFAMGTHSRYPGTWLLVGVLRLDIVRQLNML